MSENYITIDGIKIRYQVSGRGPAALLLIHGAVGSINDFHFQLDESKGLDQDQFTIVAYDLPGCGKSELPVNMDYDPTLEYFKMAAKTGARLMSELGFKTYSVGGWSDGARVASLLAVEFRSRVNSLVLWSFLPKTDARSCWAISKTRDISTWDPEALELYLSVYEEQDFSEKWRKYVDYLICSIELRRTQFDIISMLSDIKCPTLILHGSFDPIVKFREHVQPLELVIYDSSILQFKGMSQNIHQANPNKFNRVLTDFVASIGVY